MFHLKIPLRLPKQIIRAFAKNECGDSSPEGLERTLRKVYEEQQLDPHQIVRLIFISTRKRISTHSVRYWIKRVGVELRVVRPKLIDKAVLTAGFESVDEYFLSHSNNTLVDMSDELEVSLSGVQRAHTDFLIRHGGLDVNSPRYTEPKRPRKYTLRDGTTNRDRGSS